MKDKIIEFYLNNFCYIDDKENLDISFIKPLQSRRLSLVDKFSLHILNKIVTTSSENIVFASQYGEFERLKKMINQYISDNEVSPSSFSCSVHNFSPAYYLLNKKLSIPYTSIGVGTNTLSTGVLTSSITKYNNNAFCYSDVSDSRTIALGINLSKTKTSFSQKYRITLKENYPSKNSSQELKQKNEFNEFVKLFSSTQNSIVTNFYQIERISNEK